MSIINADDWEGRDLVIAQRWLPERWVIVNNGSTDRIGEIVRDYTVRSSWIELIQRPFAPS
jgi:hypothetical protein